MTLRDTATDWRSSMGVMSDLVTDATRSDYDHQEEPHPSGEPRRLPRPVTITVVALCAFLLILAFVRTRESAPFIADQRRALAERVADRADAVAERQEAVDQARLEVASAQRELLSATEAGRNLAARILRLEQLAGALPAAGSGITITVTDPPTVRGDEFAVPGLNRVLDRDLQSVVNSLWLSGAAAVAVNDLRITSRTAIRSAGAAILVDYRPVIGPYRVTAIATEGTSAVQLASSFARTPAAALLRSLKEEYAIESVVTPSGDVRVPAAVVGRR
jgi:uncharacterized protein YlxW (UPF0749 family)